MKKILKNKMINKVLGMLIIIVLLFNFCIPTYSLGFDVGGVLFKPVGSLIITVIDAINFLIGTFLGGISQIDLSHLGDIMNTLASPEYIFAGKYPILNANLFKANDDNAIFGLDNTVKDIMNGAGTSIIQKLREAVSGIYVILRNMCAVVLLCLLIYTGIRIVLSASMPNEQAKWKGYLIDWIKALALLIFIHLIMITIFYLSDLLANSLIDALGDGNSIIQIIRNECSNSWDFMPQAICLIMYIYCTYLTIIFALAYFKRVVWTAILIILAPIVSALYAIGGQGKTIYKGWFKEFLLNCLIQPFHVIIYFTLILIPVTLSTQGNEIKLLPILSNGNNIFLLIYCLIAMSLIKPAERFIRNLFGMNGSKIANTASFDSGKQLADAIGNAIKQTIITATSVGAAIATGGASAATGGTAAVAGGTSASSGNVISSGANLGGNLGNGMPMNENNPLGNVADISSVLGDDQNYDYDEYGKDYTRFVFSDGLSEEDLNNYTTLYDNFEDQVQEPRQNPVQDQVQEPRQNPVQDQVQEPRQNPVQDQNQLSDALQNLLNGANAADNNQHQGRLDSLLDRLIDRFGGRFTETPEKTKATFDAIDKIYEWRHMMGDLGKEFGDLDAAPGHRPMRFSPFLKERVNNHLAEEERQLSAMAESFANDSSVVDFYKKRILIDKDKIKNLHKRYTTYYTDGKGNRKEHFDKDKYLEEIKDEAEREARKSSEFVKYGFTNLHQIDQMRLRAKEAGVKATEDVIRYNANYTVLERDRIQRGQDVNTKEIQEAIREELMYLRPGQNINGAAIPIKIAEKEIVPRENTDVLKKLTEIGGILGDRVQDNEARVSTARTVYAIIEKGKKEGSTVSANAPGIGEDIRNYINGEINDYINRRNRSSGDSR